MTLDMIRLRDPFMLSTQIFILLSDDCTGPPSTLKNAIVFLL